MIHTKSWVLFLSFTDNSVTILKTNATFAYPVKVVLWKFYLEIRRNLIDLQRTHTALLSACTTTSDKNVVVRNQFGKLKSASSSVISLKHLLQVSMGRDARSCKNEDLNDAIREVLEPRSDSVQSGFPAMICNQSLVCHLASITSSYDIPECTNMPGVEHGGKVWPFTRCLTKVNKILELKTVQVRTVV